ncbi:hypothetical protein ACM26S_12055 [Kluyvera sichuanensis]
MLVEPCGHNQSTKRMSEALEGEVLDDVNTLGEVAHQINEVV